MLDTLGNSLKDAVKKLSGKTVIDRAAVDELVRDLQRALLSADVNVKLVMQLSQSIKKRALRRSPERDGCPGARSPDRLPGTCQIDGQARRGLA